MYFEHGFSSILYLIIAYIVVMGGLQLYQFKYRGKEEIKSFVPLGAFGLIVGIIAYVMMMRDAFDAIAAAGDVSPALVADSMARSYDFPVLGLISLAIAYLYKYLTQ